MPTDGYDPHDDSVDAMEFAAQIFQAANTGRGGAGSIFGGPGGGAGGVSRRGNTTRVSFPPGSFQEFLTSYHLNPTQKDDNDMAFTNPEAAEIAREILTDQKKEGLRAQVTSAVTELREFVDGTTCGSSLVFKKTNDKGHHYYYAAVKNGTKWYTTAQAPRVINTDDLFIEWLIGLEIFAPSQIELMPGHPDDAKALGPIETTATDA